jgi:CDP-paratose 2-epimerase
MLEAIELCQRVAGRELNWTLSERNRIGDHRWWISDVRPFAHDFPGWELKHDLESILRELHEQNAERWLAGR